MPLVNNEPHGKEGGQIEGGQKMTRRENEKILHVCAWRESNFSIALKVGGEKKRNGEAESFRTLRGERLKVSAKRYTADAERFFRSL